MGEEWLERALFVLTAALAIVLLIVLGVRYFVAD